MIPSLSPAAAALAPNVLDPRCLDQIAKPGKGGKRKAVRSPSTVGKNGKSQSKQSAPTPLAVVLSADPTVGTLREGVSPIIAHLPSTLRTITNPTKLASGSEGVALTYFKLIFLKVPHV
jgi:hypothetical protein